MGAKMVGVFIILLATSSRCYCGVYLASMVSSSSRSDPTNVNINNKNTRIRNGYVKSDFSVDFDALRTDLLEDLGLPDVPAPEIENRDEEELRRAYDLYYESLINVTTADESSSSDDDAFEEDLTEERRKVITLLADGVKTRYGADKSGNGLLSALSFPIRRHFSSSNKWEVQSATLTIKEKPSAEPKVHRIRLFRPGPKSSIVLVGKLWFESNPNGEFAEFDVTDIVRDWNRHTSGDEQILVQCSTCRRDEFNFNSTYIDVVVKSVSSAGEGFRRTKRSTNSKGKRRHGKKQKDGEVPLCESGKRTNQCCRRRMKVDFTKMPNFEFVVEPKQFDAYVCDGKCPAKHLPAHSHALLQGILHQQDKSAVPRPCCAPSKLKPLQILYYDTHGNHHVKTWDNAIALECACS